MTQGNHNNGSDLAALETQVRRARQMVRASELKVEAIEASIHEIEKFHPKIKILHCRDESAEEAENGFNLFALNAASKAV
ncbi:MAG: hypothetical protein ACRED1_12425 [Limisphaerales bacterium]